MANAHSGISSSLLLNWGLLIFFANLSITLSAQKVIKKSAISANRLITKTSHTDTVC